MNKSDKQIVSIILPTLNAEGILRDCLESIAKQTYPNIEVIGIDAHSTDNTGELIKQYGKLVLFKLEPWMAWGTPYQQNLGAAKADGEYVYFVDADMVLPPNTIEAYVQQMEEESADSMIIPEISYGEGFWAKCKILERSAYLLGDQYIEAPRFHRKTVWDKLGGVDPNMGGEYDQDIHIRLKEAGYKVTRSNIPIYHNEGRLTLRKLMKKKFTYGKSVKYFLKSHGKDPGIYYNQFNVFRPVFFRNWRKLVKDPLHTAGFLIMKSFEAVAMFVGFIISNPFSLRSTK